MPGLRNKDQLIVLPQLVLGRAKNTLPRCFLFLRINLPSLSEVMGKWQGFSFIPLTPFPALPEQAYLLPT